MTEGPGRRPGAFVISRALKVPRCGQGSLAAPTLGKALQDKLSPVFHFPLFACPFPPWERRGELCLKKSCKMHFFLLRGVSQQCQPERAQIQPWPLSPAASRCPSRAECHLGKKVPVLRGAPPSCHYPFLCKPPRRASLLRLTHAEAMVKASRRCGGKFCNLF